LSSLKIFIFTNFPKEYIKSGLIRLPRDSKDALNFKEYFKNSQKHSVELIEKEQLREYGVKQWMRLDYYLEKLDYLSPKAYKS